LYLHKPPPLPDVATLAREELKLAGLRVDAVQNSSSRMGTSDEDFNRSDADAGRGDWSK
jgi:hypothetical protein